jgi:hypothetical protein
MLGELDAELKNVHLDPLTMDVFRTVLEQNLFFISKNII